MNALERRLQAARTLGPAQAFWYALYRFGLRSGHYHRATPSQRETGAWTLQRLWPLPSAGSLSALLPAAAQAALCAEADEILTGQVRLFGGPPVPLRLQPPGQLAHWSAYELGRAAWGAHDVKDLWEPARFGWVFALGRAYQLSGDPRYPAAFWRHFEAFDAANPPNLGPNWASAQEVALRLAAYLFAASAFAGAEASTPARTARLAQACVEHARRLPITLPYARAQANNHLVSEALGLYLAGLSLPEHPAAGDWRERGWRILNQALQRQVSPTGVYCQHSTNYHRLMLQAALLADAFARREGRTWPEETCWKLWNAAHWLYQTMDPVSGRAPNLGHNDGAHFLPLAPGGFGDYRPTVQAAARVFAGGPVLPPGPWDELGLWLDLPQPSGQAGFKMLEGKGFVQQRLFTPSGEGWASLRAVHFTTRPAHADQLHVEIWQRGANLALDAGTYRYNAPAPWENALASSRVHNTVTLDGLDQMTRAGKFLWLDWAQGQFVRGEPGTGILAAMHDGYLPLGVLHHRSLRCEEGPQWVIEDQLQPYGAPPGSHTFTLHWLLPNWPYHLELPGALRLEGPGFGLRVEVNASADPPNDLADAPILQLIRGGVTLTGPREPNPLFGWVSPAYGQRIPALALRLTCLAIPPLRFHTVFTIFEPGAQPPTKPTT
jgi:hypothetical protein